MLKHVLAIVLATAAVTAGAAPVSASHPVYGCHVVGTATEMGVRRFAGGIVGHVTSPALGEPVGLACVVEVNGTPVATTSRGTGVTTTVTYGSVNVSVTPNDTVAICADWSAGDIRGYDCAGADPQVPPQEAGAVLDSVFDTLADSGPGSDAMFCLTLKLAGAPALVNLAAPATGVTMDADDCDVWDSYGRLVDFIPYGD